MTVSDELVSRVRGHLSRLGGVVSEAPVMTGLGFFVDDRMVAAVFQESLCLRVPTTQYDSLLGSGRVSPFRVAGRPVPSWVLVASADLDDTGLAEWVRRGLSPV